MKTLFIIGVSSGIGYELAEKFYKLIPKLKSFESGSFIDIRNIDN